MRMKEEQRAYSFFSLLDGKTAGKGKQKKKGISLPSFFFLALACSSLLILSRRVHRQRREEKKTYIVITTVQS